MISHFEKDCITKLQRKLHSSEVLAKHVLHLMLDRLKHLMLNFAVLGLVRLQLLRPELNTSEIHT